MNARIELTAPQDPTKDEGHLGKGDLLGQTKTHGTSKLCLTEKRPPIEGSDGGQADRSRHLEGRGPCYGRSAAEPARAPKEWVTAQALATIAGFVAVLSKNDAGRPELIVSRWASTRAFDSLAELDAWLVRVGAKA